MRKYQRGFTLVEIAIVLVIIGLLLGGVLKGQEMIENAKYKSLRNEINAYSAAFYAFQDRYRALPGDFDQASTRIDSAAPNGNGNGAIAGGACNRTNDESCILWQQLRYAGLISGKPADSGSNANPNHSYGGQIRGIYTGTNGGVSGNWMILQNVPVDVARRLDEDIDDGQSRSGSVYCATGRCSSGYPTSGNPVEIRIKI
ncbi:MAG TPA: prepilin-type N-terminal cleavage/methylation domain-containing protein [Thiotrichales bacterium]|nr:prepilin-type N-terminal cleavage/methylation domain-containing protein [Thiotrichales bacterium]